MKIYLGGSIAGGRDFEKGLKVADAVLKKMGHEILTPSVVDTELNGQRFPNLNGKEKAVAVFEVSQPSTGVGEEIGFLIGSTFFTGKKRPTLFLRHGSLKEEKISSLVLGNPYGKLVHYTPETLENNLKDFFDEVEREGRIDREIGR